MSMWEVLRQLDRLGLHYSNFIAMIVNKPSGQSRLSSVLPMLNKNKGLLTVAQVK